MYEIDSLRLTDFYGNVGKHTISMDPMGKGNHLRVKNPRVKNRHSRPTSFSKFIS